MVGSNPAIIFGKNTGGGNRNAYMGYTDNFFFTIGDWGNSNAGPNTGGQNGVNFSEKFTKFTKFTLCKLFGNFLINVVNLLTKM